VSSSLIAFRVCVSVNFVFNQVLAGQPVKGA